jgi:hypothetical protein
MMRTRRDVVRRHRRERQFLVFGLLVGLLAAVGAIGLAVFQGRIDPPFDRAIVTPPPDFSTDITVPCPPVGAEESLPMPAGEVSLRVRNATDKTGLARDTLEVLTGRGFVAASRPTNWDNKTYAEAVRIQFGVDGLRQAYTIAAHFPEVELVLDNREGAVVDIILGERFEVSQMRPTYAPELDPTTELTGPVLCLPVDRTPQRPAPHIIPVDPLAPVVTPSPSPSPSA